MAISRWEPLGELRHMREMLDRVFEEPFYMPSLPRPGEGARVLPIDVYEMPDHLLVKATVAGVKPEDVDISMAGNLLTIRAERKEEVEEKGKELIRRERYFGRFERSMTLPVSVQAEKAQATFENGELTLRLPKAEEAKAKQIKVQTTKQ
ncbi:MAG: Hsp20/alpha crystallin family protein [Chloroflexi bacterium]|nr:Hsp20/alpha crystallin family protein [Chloroflexota bacterium]